MLRFEWNALRAGDDVLLHDDSKRDQALIPGTVSFVEMTRRKKGTNGVGVLVAGATEDRVLWPEHVAVHAGGHAVIEGCWRCDLLLAQTSRAVATP